MKLNDISELLWGLRVFPWYRNNISLINLVHIVLMDAIEKVNGLG